MAPDDRPIEHVEPAAAPAADPAGAAPGIVVDAFGYVPLSASRIAGLGGDRAADDPHYAFHTVYRAFEPGATRAVLRFDDLVAGVGELMVRVFSYAEARTNQVREEVSTTVFLREIAVSKRPFAIDFPAEPGIQYAIVGHIYSPTDARAAGLSIEIGHGEDESDDDAGSPAESAFGQGKARRMFALRSVRPISFAFPVSQPFTAAQLTEDAFGEWRKRLPAGMAPPDQWEAGFILQTLQVYGRLQPGAHGLGFGPAGDPVGSLVRGMKCAVTIVEAASLDDVDAGVDRATASGGRHAGFDFLWSRLTASTLGSDADIREFVSRTMDYLALGGLAVHIFAAMPGASARAAPEEGWIDQNGIGKIALDSVARGHIVAQLKADRNPALARVRTPPVPFGLIVRKSNDAIG